MKIDFGTMLETLRGEPLETMVQAWDEKCKTCGLQKVKKIQMSLGYACSEALLGMLDTDKSEDGVSKYKRGELAGKIINAKEPIALEPEEIVQIKERIGMTYGPIVVVVVYDLLKDKENGK